jgi:hypothetical protein
MAEVKVKITAANQTQTGFQSVLADAKKTATQVQQTFSRTSAPTFRPIPQGKAQTGDFSKELADLANAASDGTKAAAQEMIAELRRAREEAKKTLETLDEPATGGMFGPDFVGRIGEFAARLGVATAIGKVAGDTLAQPFRDLAQRVSESTTGLQQMATAAQSVSQATTIEAAVSGFDSMGSSIQSAREQLSELRSDLSAVVANALTGGQAFAVMAENIEAMSRLQASALTMSAALQLQQAQETATAFESGGSNAVDQLALKQRRDREMAALQDRLSGATDPNTRLALQSAIEDTQLRFAAEDRIRLAGAKEGAGNAAQRVAEFGMTPEQRLQKEKQAMAELQAEQQKFASAAAMASADPTGGLNEAAARYYELQQQIEASKLAQLELDKQIADAVERAAKATAAAQRSAMASAQSQAQANRVATMTPQEQLDFEMQGLADLQGFVGPEVEAQKQAAIGRIMALQSQIQNQGQGAMVGSFGASALQRIGFASNEFFDTRRREDPEKETKRAADAAKEILKILQGGEPLVLPASN